MRYATLLLLLVGSNCIWGQIKFDEFTMTTQLKTIATSTMNNGRWIYIKPEANLTSNLLFEQKVALNLSELSTFKMTTSVPLKDAYVMERHDQYLNNIKVVNAAAIVYLNNGIVDRVQGDWVKDMPVFNTFVLTPEAIVASVLALYPATEYSWQNDFEESSLKRRKKNPEATYYPKPEQVYYKKDDKLYAAFTLEIHANNPSFNYKLIINAENGEVLDQENLMHDCFGHLQKGITPSQNKKSKHFGKTINNTISASDNNSNGLVCSPFATATSLYGVKIIKCDTDEDYSTKGYPLKNNCDGSEYILYDYSGGANYLFYSSRPNFSAAATAFYGLQKTKEYYKTTFNRNSWDNDYGDIDVLYNAAFTKKDANDDDVIYYDNASFLSGTLRIGNSESQYNSENKDLLNDHNAIDVIGHEFTHGVVATTSELVYKNESGALNESFADIFGNLIEIYTEGENSGVWNLEEDRIFPHKDGPVSWPIRDMTNPKRLGQPDTYKGEKWDFAEEVHANSGVQNYFFYLLCKGGKGVSDYNYNFDVTGVGIEIGQFLAYKTLKALTSNSTYFDAHLAWLTQAEIYYGKCSPVYTAVKEAWTAVGVNTSNELLKFCDTTVDLNIHTILGTNNSLNQTLIGGIKSADVNCETQITNSGAEEERLTAARVILISGNTTISGNGPIIFQTSGDPCKP